MKKSKLRKKMQSPGRSISESSEKSRKKIQKKLKGKSISPHAQVESIHEDDDESLITPYPRLKEIKKAKQLQKNAMCAKFKSVAKLPTSKMRIVVT